MNDKEPRNGPKADQSSLSRRKFLKTAAVAGGTAAAVTGFPYIRTEAADTTTWKIQTSWPGGIGLEVFKTWSNGIVEKTGGELAFKPFGAKEVVGEFQLFDAVKNGVIEAMNPFTLYWAGRMPAAVFLSSYPLGLRNPHEWDVFFYALGGREIARKLFAEKLWTLIPAQRIIGEHMKSLQEWPPRQRAQSLSLQKAMEAVMKQLEKAPGVMQ